MFQKLREKREAELKRQKKEVVKKVGVALVIGSVVSAITTLFTAPKSGKELRNDISTGVENGTERLKDNAIIIKDKTAVVLEDAVQKGQEIKNKISDKISQTLSERKSQLDETIENAEEIVEDVKETIEEDLEANKNK